MYYSKSSFCLTLLAIPCGEKQKKYSSSFCQGGFLTNYLYPQKETQRDFFVALPVLIAHIFFSRLVKGRKNTIQ